jgi:serine/threonine protein kinase
MSDAHTLPDSPSRQRSEGSLTLPLEVSTGAADPASAEDNTATFYPQGPAAARKPNRAASAPVPPDLVDHPRYAILDYLGAGGMGTVYKARHRLMDRLVALKVINRDLAGRRVTVERFRREVRAAARLSHPNIVAAFDADRSGDTYFLVMELVEGIDLDQVLQSAGRLPVARACDYAGQTARGLQHAWECGLVHRDIKPHNLMLTTDGCVKILDFGLSRFLSDVGPLDLPMRPPSGEAGGESPPADEQATLPKLGTPPCPETPYASTGAGTADYLAPEETVGARQADIRSDIYSLGCTLYRFLSGRVPFPDGGLAHKIRCHREQAPQPLARLCPELPVRLCQVVERMMAKEPSERFQTPAEVAQALAPFASRTRAPSSSSMTPDEPRS